MDPPPDAHTSSSECLGTGSPDAPVVSCGPGLTCQGATSICCTDSMQSQFYCMAHGEDCNRAATPEDNIANTCDDAADCATGQLCCSSYNKGLSRIDPATCGSWCDPTYPLDQVLCTEDCQCPSGITCKPSTSPGHIKYCFE